jgi:hypothetical protein
MKLIINDTDKLLVFLITVYFIKNILIYRQKNLFNLSFSILWKRRRIQTKRIPDCVVFERGRNFFPWAVFPPSELTSRCVVEIIIKLCHQLWQRHSRRGSFYCRSAWCRAGCWCGGGQGAQPVFFDVCPLIAGLPLETRPKVTKVWVEWAMGVALVTSPPGSGLTDAGAGFVLYLEDQTHPSLPKSAQTVCVCVFPTRSLQVAKFEPLSSPFTNIFPFPLRWCLFFSLSVSYIAVAAFLLRAAGEKSTFPSALWRILFTSVARGCCCYCGIWKGSCHINFERDSLVWDDEFRRGASASEART